MKLCLTSIFLLASGKEEDNDSVDELIEVGKRLLIGVIGFGALLLICVGVHFGHNACLKYTGEQKGKQKRV